ncbi:MAG: hypothetical protein A3I44_02620 [Candidatus Sungbacteria bacterium RIFCSPLOWO2_02_FULL_51_17]|uniref:Uncharacterized protein n=1 Tax=Candidatus Sungbacteria bacterium RIFCSPHIGHO2_02_FULL_51_29 TaxID=1802273 RepID=A0A1G2KVH8_9BACT|nr:MAG: hypothetical protein A2676_00180 [Candidatus Sungbacteria bacterium RIFCSPHIGHO2_01_FULL_51_22]OHA02461.1 MAG: hypothetical protein A3C16_05290 [Candidatus Sungbacteria bacterium RIFCSPHIGHO2_02_FULL_51_29]OHA06737.1 MAG: hypothetical protein A3B29_00895 [Candidatus Sungbacteria bacterium RIFCSPLOWO2_01_FULL_51_34]OHA11961.1 MAG: hypothetical protein A3I44_02620 [Candidatus Sungbacteria bacterium RIFCSPLOWO2_02_FULL_51_17]
MSLIFLIVGVVLAIMGGWYVISGAYYMRKAEGHLKWLRNRAGWSVEEAGKSRYPLSEISWVIYLLNRGGSYDMEDPTNTGIAPEWIGSSKAELTELWKKAYRFHAERALRMLRDHSAYVSASVLKIYIEEAGSSLAEFGTSEEEIDRLAHENHLLMHDIPDWFKCSDHCKSNFH